MSAVLAGVGSTLVRYDLDVDECTLAQTGTLQLPGQVEYGWAHGSLPVLYVSCAVTTGESQTQRTCAVLLDGALSLLGPVVDLPHRALSVTVDSHSRHLLLSHHRPAGITVLRIEGQGTLGTRVDQPDDLDLGAFPHQVRVSHDDRFCFCVSRGVPNAAHGAAGRRAQTQPGSVTVLPYQHGRLSSGTTMTLGDGHEFGPRNLDLHPTSSKVYLALETQSEIVVLDRTDDGLLDPAPVQRLSTLSDPYADVHQGLGPIVVHPRGHVVYVANRAYVPGLVTPEQKIVSSAAENSIAVFAVHPRTGLLSFVQRVDSGGACPRTISLDPNGAVLVVANSETYAVGDGEHARTVPANLTTFAVGDDGRLTFGHSYDTADASDVLWAAVVDHAPAPPREETESQ